jgi:hypothetical protein
MSATIARSRLKPYSTLLITQKFKRAWIVV